MTPDLDARVVAEARAWIGTPYAHQASLKGVGCDCLGLLRGVWRGVIGAEPERPGPYAPDWAEASPDDALMRAAARWLVPADAIGPGRVLVFRWRAGLPAKHCAIATAPDAMIHAHDGARVCEVTIPPFWRRRVAGVFGFPSPTGKERNAAAWFQSEVNSWPPSSSNPPARPWAGRSPGRSARWSGGRSAGSPGRR